MKEPLRTHDTALIGKGGIPHAVEVLPPLLRNWSLLEVVNKGLH